MKSGRRNGVTPDQVKAPTDRQIADVLLHVRRIALLGASAQQDRPSFRVLRFLVDCGYEVYPVNPQLAGEILYGRPVHADLAAVPAPIDMVDVFRRPEHLPAIVDDILKTSARVLWTQLGVIHAEALSHAEASGLTVVADRCPAIEWPRLQLLGLLPARSAMQNRASLPMFGTD